LCAVEAVGAARNRPDLPVEAFRPAVGEPRGDVGQDSFEVTAECACQLAEWRQPRACSPADPLEELLPGDVDLATVEDRGEGFLEHVGSVERLIDLLHLGDLCGLEGREVPWVLVQCKA